MKLNENLTDISGSATVTFLVSHADGSTLEVTMPDTIAPSVRLRSCGSMRITVTSNASPATSINRGTLSNSAETCCVKLDMSELSALRPLIA